MADSDLIKPMEQQSGHNEMNDGTFLGRSAGTAVPSGKLIKQGIIEANGTSFLVPATEPGFKTRCPGIWQGDVRKSAENSRAEKSDTDARLKQAAVTG